MSECVFVSVSPDQPNIYYEVCMRREIVTDFANLLSSLQLNLSLALQVILYCHTLNVCSNLYAYFLYELGTALYYPPGASQPATTDSLAFFTVALLSTTRMLH